MSRSYIQRTGARRSHVYGAILGLLALLAANATAFAQSLPPWSVWQNQRGSFMKIFGIDPQGNFTGLYINNAPGFACQGLPGFALTGHTKGAAVAFRVAWNNGIQNCNSTTVWTGRFSGAKLPTTWVLFGPNGTQRGADIFTQQ